MKAIRTQSTSIRTAITDDIILRQTDSTRLIFRPLLIDNPNDAQHAVKGTFIYQRKRKDDAWEILSESSLANLRSGEGISLSLDSKELYLLSESIGHLYDIVADNKGVPRGKNAFLVTDKNMAEVVAQLSKSPDSVARILQEGSIDLLPKTMEWLASLEQGKDVIDKLKNSSLENLEQVSSLLGLSTLKKVAAYWEEHRLNTNEEFWQNLFTRCPWLLAQLFATPVVLFKDKAYVGGKTIKNTGGRIVDYIYKNRLTSNTAVIEIKTPNIPLVGPEYRDQVFPPSAEVSGGIVQLLNYKNKLVSEIRAIAEEDGEKLFALYPKAFLIVGDLEEAELNVSQLKSFELFRSSQTEIDIVTFDEVFDKLKNLIKVMELNDFDPGNITHNAISPNSQSN